MKEECTDIIMEVAIHNRVCSHVILKFVVEQHRDNVYTASTSAGMK
jgi:hypothetical protein